MEEYIDMDALMNTDDVEASNEGHIDTPQSSEADEIAELINLDDFFDNTEDLDVTAPLPSPSDSMEFEIDVINIDEEDQTVPDNAPSTSSGIQHDEHHQSETVNADTSSGSSGYSDTMPSEEFICDMVRQRLILKKYHPITICIICQQNVDDLVSHVHALLKLFGIENIPDLIEMAKDVKSKFMFHLNAMGETMQRIKAFHKMCTQDTRFHNLNGLMPYHLIPLLHATQNTTRFESPTFVPHAKAKEKLDEQMHILNAQLKDASELIRFLKNEFVALLKIMDEIKGL